MLLEAGIKHLIYIRGGNKVILAVPISDPVSVNRTPFVRLTDVVVLHRESTHKGVVFNADLVILATQSTKRLALPRCPPTHVSAESLKADHR